MAGTYTISLTVVDDEGAQSSISTSEITVPSVLPMASFTVDVNKKTVTFNAEGSTDIYGTIGTYVWSFGDGNTSTTSEALITYTYETAG